MPRNIYLVCPTHKAHIRIALPLCMATCKKKCAVYLEKVAELKALMETETDAAETR